MKLHQLIIIIMIIVVWCQILDPAALESGIPTEYERERAKSMGEKCRTETIQLQFSEKMFFNNYA